MTDATRQDAGPMPGTTRSMVADEGLPRRLVDGYMRTSRASTVGMVVACVFITVGGYAITGNLRSLLVSGAIALVLLAVFFGLRGYAAWQLRRATTAAYPVGEKLTLTVSPEGIDMTTATGRSEVRASAIRKVTVSGEAVLLRLANMPGAAAAIIPRALLPDEDIALLRSGGGHPR